MAVSFVTTESPLGRLLLASTDKNLIGCWFMGAKHFPPVPEERLRQAPFLSMPGVAAESCDCGCKGPRHAEDLQKIRQRKFPPTPPAVLLGAVMELGAYFQGTRTTFSLPMDPIGTPFQKNVWEYLRGIPLGESRTYAEAARALGREKAVRAVGAAVGRNPLSIFIPCHRILGSSGSLTGYAGGLDRKKALLELEGILFTP